MPRVKFPTIIVLSLKVTFPGPFNVPLTNVPTASITFALFLMQTLLFKTKVEQLNYSHFSNCMRIPIPYLSSLSSPSWND